MMQLIEEILNELEEAIKVRNAERAECGLPSLPRVEIRLLGQFSLMVDPETSRALNPAVTMDMDALIKGEWVIEQDLRDILKHKGLKLDDLSSEIWIPPNSRFVPLYRSRFIVCSYLDPLAVLVSKAIKAKAKNRLLIQEAIAFYGEKLIKLIKEYGGDLEYFLRDDED